MGVFGIRGGRAVGLLLNNWKFFRKSLDESTSKAEDFAEIMKRIAEDNIPGLAKKVANAFKAIGFVFLNEFETPFMSMLKRVEDALDIFRSEEEIRSALGETTKVQATAKALPSYGGALGAYGASRLFGGSFQIQQVQQQAQILPGRNAEILDGYHLKREGLRQQVLSRMVVQLFRGLHGRGVAV